MTEVIRKLFYNGELIGKVVKSKTDSGTRIESALSEWEVIDAINDMDPQEKIGIYDLYPDLIRVISHYRINPNEYITDEDIVIYVVDKGYRSIGELSIKEMRVREMVKKRGLEDRIFPRLQPA